MTHIEPGGSASPEEKAFRLVEKSSAENMKWFSGVFPKLFPVLADIVFTTLETARP